MFLKIRTLFLFALIVACSSVTLTLDGAPAVVGNYSKSSSSVLVFDNELLHFTITAASGGGVQMSEWIISGSSINLAETSESTWYEDWSGGKSGNVAGVDTIRILRVTDSLVEVVLADTRHPLRRFEQHLIMINDVRGIYTFTVMTVVASGEQLNEIRHNTRWDRCVLNYAFNHERPFSQQPMYPYLYTQIKIQDETWQVDAVNNATLPCPRDNAGNADGKLPAGSIYTKYEWSLYHHENPFFGHFGLDSSTSNLIGIWLTPLGGVTNATSAATYGVGPQHQDLAIHQDGLILNYMDANHYGLPAYPVPRGYTRLYGPYLHHSTIAPSSNIEAFFADAANVAFSNIAAANVALPFIDHLLYPIQRSNVTGKIAISDGRPSGNIFVILSTERANDVFIVHEPTRFVLTESDGSFVITGVPAGSYCLYLQAAGGSITDLYVSPTDISVGVDPVVDLGLITWTPSDADFSLLFQLGEADRTGGEFALSRRPRDWFLPGLIPSDVTFKIGTNNPSTDWYYAQTQGGTWTIQFDLSSAQTGTAYLTVSASLTDGYSPVVAVNGDTSGIDGAMPSGEDSTLSRQAVRSGFPKVSVLSFDATRLKVGTNEISFSRPYPPGGSNNTGMGYDIIKLQVGK
jgi:rhamnogalacturonan endolyase